jgi:hypothetical protein
VRKFGPIGHADVTFGDLTVLVGPQATGKSVFLECLNLVVDAGYIQEELTRHGLDWGRRLDPFLDLYFGEGMMGLWRERQTTVELNEAKVDFQSLASRKRPSKNQSLFFIPAQRVLTLRDGWPRPFSDYSPGDPFAVREFSERLRMLMEKELGKNPQVFPAPKRFKSELKEELDRDIFSGFRMWVETHRSQKRLVLRPETQGPSLPYMVWSAGQREFVPLMLGLYWLMPGAALTKRAGMDWVVIEELEMGLHPRAISAVLIVVLDLLSRGYRVCMSSHSPHILDLVWAVSICKKHGGSKEDLADLFFDKRPSGPILSMFERSLKKELKVYYFAQAQGSVQEISDLDPGACDRVQSEWGGLTEFSSRAAEVVAAVVSRKNGRRGKKDSGR